MSEQRASGVARRLVSHLLGLGVTDVVLAPGSRSGPIAIGLHAADTAGALRLHVRVDEREAGFLALGLAKATGRPVPVVTTSGTAVANLHPAMLEALHAGVPLVAVTADRPARLRGTGANQTTDQREIFPGVTFVDRVKELHPVDGPVHLNLELDDPLLEPVEWDLHPAFGTGTVHLPGEVATLDPGPRTVVVAGDSAQAAVGSLARDAHWPVIAEPSSGLRSGTVALTAGRVVLAPGSRSGPIAIGLHAADTAGALR
ncbi:MAG: 2-succinyl-5-enolpyruvyl-6-hydroxy-3-cyclohexene-1-carboxylate synthase, partial [Actinomycetales bacterium]